MADEEQHLKADLNVRQTQPQQDSLKSRIRN
jgi:hypothetical protein